MLAFICYLGTIILANWAISTFGMVPVGFGLAAPAGVFFAGLAFTFRDLTQERWGRKAVVGAIFAGAALSTVFGGQVALASGVAFLLSELVDFAVYTPLRRRAFLGAVALSNTVGAALDSAIFLTLAFGSLEYLWGQIVGKSWVTLFSVGVIFVARQSLYRRGNMNGIQVDSH